MIMILIAMKIVTIATLLAMYQAPIQGLVHCIAFVSEPLSSRYFDPHFQRS